MVLSRRTTLWLKSTRDQLNRPGEVNLMLVMSGSDRGKLLRLVNTNGAPFYGSQISRMPPLAQDFIDHVSRLITAQRPDLAPVDGATLVQASHGSAVAVMFSAPDDVAAALRRRIDDAGQGAVGWLDEMSG